MNPGGCETARFSLYLSRKYFTVHNRHIWEQSALRNAVVLFKAISLRSNGSKFLPVQVTTTKKICDCGPNSPEITESLPGCYNGTRMNKQNGGEFASGPVFTI